MPELNFDKVKSREDLDRQIFNAATSFTVVMMLGAGKRDREDYPTLAQAIERAKVWKGPRQPLVYAVTPQGRSCVLDRADWPRLLEEHSLKAKGSVNGHGLKKSDPFFIPDFLNRAKWSPERWKQHEEAMAKAAEDDRIRREKEKASQPKLVSLNKPKKERKGGRLRGKAREELAFKIVQHLGSVPMSKKGLFALCKPEMEWGPYKSGLRRAIKLDLILKERFGKRKILYVNPRARAKGEMATTLDMAVTLPVKTKKKQRQEEAAVVEKAEIKQKSLVRKSLKRKPLK